MPQALHFSRKLFRTAKGPIPEDDFPRPGEDVAQRDWGSLLPARPRAAAFSGVENCMFPRLFHTEKRQRPGVENLWPVHSRLEKNKSPLKNGL